MTVYEKDITLYCENEYAEFPDTLPVSFEFRDNLFINSTAGKLINGLTIYNQQKECIAQFCVNGDLVISGEYKKGEPLPSIISEGLVFKNHEETPVALITKTGNLYTTGELKEANPLTLIEYSSSERSYMRVELNSAILYTFIGLEKEYPVFQMVYNDAPMVQVNQDGDIYLSGKLKEHSVNALRVLGSF